MTNGEPNPTLHPADTPSDLQQKRKAKLTQIKLAWSIVKVQARWRGYVTRQRNKFSWPSPLIEDFSRPIMSPPLLQEGFKNIEWVKQFSSLLIRVVTWNLCANSPPSTEFFTGILPRNRFHIYVIGSEECERSIAQSAVNPSKKNWEADLQLAVGQYYVPLRSHTLQAIHIIAFAHVSIIPLIGEVRSAALAMGIGNTLGNKGAVGISFKVGRTRFCFVNAHLEAHQRAWETRNLQFNRVHKEMATLLMKAECSKEIGLAEGSTASAAAQVKHLEPYTLPEYAERVVFMGDFNYRLNGNRAVVDSMIKLGMHDALLVNDQLKVSQSKSQVPGEYIEPPLNFKPSYKFDIDSDDYDTSIKKRVPSWTDRVLYVTNGFECVAYNADFSIRTSDHRPVFASFIAKIDLSGDHRFDGDKRIEFTSPSQVCSVM